MHTLKTTSHHIQGITTISNGLFGLIACHKLGHISKKLLEGKLKTIMERGIDELKSLSHSKNIVSQLVIE